MTRRQGASSPGPVYERGLRVAILYSTLSGYTAACQRALKEFYDAELMVIYWPVSGEAPYSEAILQPIDHAIDKSRLTRATLRENLERFKPQIALLAGWMDRDYLWAGRFLRKAGVTVVAGTDTQWSGSLRQRLGQLVAPWYLHRAIDALWVAGERQRQLAWRLGYRGLRCFEGYYSADWDLFEGVREERPKPPPSTFLFVGRYLSRKGLDVLVDAYRLYRKRTAQPWKLVTAGTGPLADLLRDEAGVEDRGFVQPENLPPLMREAGGFILPSRREPWGVALHEAAAAGLPLICSDNVGAGVHLLREGYNGYLFRRGSVWELAQAMERLSTLSEAAWADMSARSYELSRQYTPRRWARQLVEGVRALKQTE